MEVTALVCVLTSNSLLENSTDRQFVETLRGSRLPGKPSGMAHAHYVPIDTRKVQSSDSYTYAPNKIEIQEK